MIDFKIKKGEGKWLKFTLTRNDTEINLTTATCKLGVKETYEDAAYIIEKDDGDFNKAEAAQGILYVNLTATDTNITPGMYIMELRTIITADVDVDKSETYSLEIQNSVIT